VVTVTAPEQKIISMKGMATLFTTYPNEGYTTSNIIIITLKKINRLTPYAKN